MTITDSKSSQLIAVCLTFCLSIALLCAKEKRGDECEKKKPEQPSHQFRTAYEAAHEAGIKALNMSYSSPKDSRGYYFEYGGRICVCEIESCIWYSYNGPYKGEESQHPNKGLMIPSRFPSCAILGGCWKNAGVYHSHPEGGEISEKDCEYASPEEPVWMSRNHTPRNRRTQRTETWRTTGCSDKTRIKP